MSVSNQGKKCTKCRTWKPFTEFYRSKNLRDGFTSWCKECNKKLSKEQYRQNRNATDTAGNKYKVKLVCEICGNEFVRYTSYLEKFDKIYCSRECYSKTQIKPRISLTCAYCNSEIKLTPGDFNYRGKINENFYCSTDCYYKGERIYDFNEEFFHKVHEYSAYWLGFIFADGAVRPEHNRLEIRLNEVDKSHLEKFLNNLNLKKELVRTNNNAFRLTIDSKQMVELLISVGIVPHKKLFDLSYIPEEYIRHFWRGLFDGDGSITKHGNKKWWIFGLVGSYEMMIEAEKFFGPASRRPHSQSKEVWTFIATGTQKPYRFMSKIYNEANIYLDRKYERFLRMKEEFDCSEQLTLL